MANTYTLITSNTISTPAYTFTMSSIPQTYTDLMLVCSIRSDYSNSSEAQILINGLTSGYNGTLFSGTNGYVGSSQGAFTWSMVMNGSSTTANTFANLEIVIPSYSSTTLPKTLMTNAITENNSSSNAFQWMVASRNTTTSAVTSITFQAWQSFINFAAGSSFYLYGIKNS